MGRKPCCEKTGLKRGPWTVDEDQKLMNFILNNGIHCWRLVPKLAGLLRCGKSCRLRWINYLRPDLKRGALSEMEENQIIQLHSRLGNRWSKIAAHFSGRTDNEIKNHWNTRIKKKLKLLGLDPMTHKPIDRSAENFRPRDAQEKNQEIGSANDRCHEDFTGKAIQDGFEFGLDDRGHTIYSHGMLWESLDVEGIKIQSNPSSSCTTSYSFEDTLLPSVVGNSSIVEESKLYWSHNSECCTHWDGLNSFEEIFSIGNHQ